MNGTYMAAGVAATGNSYRPAKAAQSMVNSLTQTVNTKASQAVPDGLTQTVTGHTTALNGKGNCQIYYTTYVGNSGASWIPPCRWWC